MSIAQDEITICKICELRKTAQKTAQNSIKKSTDEYFVSVKCMSIKSKGTLENRIMILVQTSNVIVLLTNVNASEIMVCILLPLILSNRAYK